MHCNNAATSFAFVKAGHTENGCEHTEMMWTSCVQTTGSIASLCGTMSQKKTGNEIHAHQVCLEVRDEKKILETVATKETTKWVSQKRMLQIWVTLSHGGWDGLMEWMGKKRHWLIPTILLKQIA